MLVLLFLISDIRSLCGMTKRGRDYLVEPLISGLFPSSRNVLSITGWGTSIHYDRCHKVRKENMLQAYGKLHKPFGAVIYGRFPRRNVDSSSRDTLDHFLQTIP